MTNKENVQIFISYHKNSEMIKSDIMRPIQVNAKRAGYDLGVLRDDTGDHISEKNPLFCELTAQYWAWKNTDADYYGFMHYRRHFVFKEIKEVPDDGGLLHFKRIDGAYKEKIGLDDESICRAVDGVDVVLPTTIDLSGWCAPSNEIQYSCLRNLHAKDFDTVCRVIEDLFPEDIKYMNQFRHGHYVYWYNMFIMKKSIFMDYCNWLFAILFEAEKRINFDDYDTQELRCLAFFAERLFSIYMMKLETETKSVVCHKKITFVHQTDNHADTIADEEQIEYIDWLNRGLNKAFIELGDLDLLPATDENRLAESINRAREINEKTIYIYGAGNYGWRILQCMQYLGWKEPIEIWDIDSEKKTELAGVKVVYPRFDSMLDEDALFVISIANREISNSVRERILDTGVTEVIEKDSFMKLIVNSIWAKKLSGKDNAQIFAG